MSERAAQAVVAPPKFEPGTHTYPRLPRQRERLPNSRRSKVTALFYRPSATCHLCR